MSRTLRNARAFRTKSFGRVTAPIQNGFDLVFGANGRAFSRDGAEAWKVADKRFAKRQASRARRRLGKAEIAGELAHIIPVPETPAEKDFRERTEHLDRQQAEMDREWAEICAAEEKERQAWVDRGASDAALHLFDDPSYVKWLERNNPEYLYKVWGVDEEGRFTFTREMERAEWLAREEVAA